jgi:non-heme chloroperoxidase
MVGGTLFVRTSLCLKSGVNRFTRIGIKFILGFFRIRELHWLLFPLIPPEIESMKILPMQFIHRVSTTWMLFVILTLSAATANAGGSPLRALELDRASLPTGVTLEYVERGWANGPPVLFIHGWLDSRKSFQQVINRFPLYYRSIAPSMRGHGLSDKPASGYLMSDYAADVVALMDELNIERAHFVGHSMGTAIAQQIAISNPERVDCMVLLGGAANIADNPVLGDPEFVDFINGLSDPVDQGLVQEFVESLFIQPGDPLFVDLLVREELLVTANTWIAGLAGLLDFNSIPDLSSIQAPTLIIFGDQDQLFSLADQQDLLDGIPNAWLRIWPETGHAMHWENPTRAAMDINRFLWRCGHNTASHGRR